MDALLELQESQLQFIYNKKLAQNLFHNDSKSKSSPSRPQKESDFAPASDTTIESTKNQLKAPYIYKNQTNK